MNDALDAARYRWLRDNKVISVNHPSLPPDNHDVEAFTMDEVLCGHDFDSAIDDAMERQKWERK